MIEGTIVEGFLLGVIAVTSLLAALYFLRFWRDTRDTLFLAFSAAFLIEGLNRTARIFFENPSEASPWVFIVRAFAFLIIIAGIIGKNRRSGARQS
ncbi:MAG TPA: DUF5985 family protein [Acidobacteriaceae bacterium]|jgi:hypothetical protein|nr:DUF5985 family protein [Acidobacteriaceae bacterium]